MHELLHNNHSTLTLACPSCQPEQQTARGHNVESSTHRGFCFIRCQEAEEDRAPSTKHEAVSSALCELLVGVELLIDAG